MSHETVHFTYVERVKIAFWTFDWIFVPRGFKQEEDGNFVRYTLLGTENHFKQRIFDEGIIQQGEVFPRGSLVLMIRYFPSFSLLWSYSPKYTLQKRASTLFFTTPSPPCDRVPQRNDDDNRPRTRKKYIPNQLEYSFYHFFFLNVLLMFFGKQILLYSFFFS